jgi:segregation and condensation protein B
MANTPEQLQRILEAALMVAGRPLTVADLQKLFDEAEQPDAKLIREVLEAVQASYSERGIELLEVASGFQFQAKADLSPWLARLWEERAPRFTRAFLETVALIAYRQPITRAEIEEIRGVAVSSNIIKTLQEREWIRVIGHRDVPGKPALYGTTKTFLDHLNLKSLDQLPSLAELMDLDSQEEKLHVQLELGEATDADIAAEQAEIASNEEMHEIKANEHDDTCAHDDEDEHEHTDACSHDDEEKHEHTDACSHDDEEELCDDEHEHDEECMHDDEEDEYEHEHTEACSHDDEKEIDLEDEEEALSEEEHEHTEACSHDDIDDITLKHEQTFEEDESNDITSDPYPKETSKA